MHGDIQFRPRRGYGGQDAVMCQRLLCVFAFTKDTTDEMSSVNVTYITNVITTLLHYLCQNMTVEVLFLTHIKIGFIWLVGGDVSQFPV